MKAICTSGGVPMQETVLCDKHWYWWADMAEVEAANADDFDTLAWSDVTGTKEVACFVCGWDRMIERMEREQD